MFDRLRLSTRLSAGFGVLLLLLVVALAAAAWQMGRMAANTEAFAGNIVPSLELQHRMSEALAAVRRWELRHVLSDDTPEMDRIEGEITKERARLGEAIDLYERTLLADDEDRRHLKLTRAAVETYLGDWEKVRVASRKTADDPAADKEVKAILVSGLKVYQAAQREIDEWWAYNVKLSDTAKQDSDSSYAQAKGTLMALALVALVLGVGAALAITRSVLRQLGGEPVYAKEVVGEIAQGHLGVKIALRHGDTDSLLAAMESMRERLATLVTQVRASSDSIATGSSQIASGNADLSQRTEEQASNLQQTAASMEQLNSTVKNNADSARQANQLAGHASSAAEKGGQAVGQVISTMQDISESSRRIADIIGTIDGIAFQTNILALNAAVEAARAGEQGRGFAVVAGEVRTLAQRSAEAAREIKSLISASSERVEAGSRLVDDAGATMADVVVQVKRVADLISEISAATLEQTSGIGQVSDAVTQLDQVTQQNAALVEESAAAAESLRHQSEQLARTVGVFRLAA